jgi:hypothetical protein
MGPDNMAGFVKAVAACVLILSDIVVVVAMYRGSNIAAGVIVVAAAACVFMPLQILLWRQLRGF